ncbi:hypothetical protein LSAT2_009842 [Lamellibrachia satsuma]|nr:hypothetical protein LSAT2_009842 [Lamellibrachia satsuma]
MVFIAASRTIPRTERGHLHHVCLRVDANLIQYDAFRFVHRCLSSQSLAFPLKFTSEFKQSNMLVVAIAMFLCLTAVSVTESADLPTPPCLFCMCLALGWNEKQPTGHGKSYKTCVKDPKCSMKTVRGYMSRYVKNSHNQNCERYARVHYGGPYGWKWGTDSYWNDVKRCCNSVVSVEQNEKC